VPAPCAAVLNILPHANLEALKLALRRKGAKDARRPLPLTRSSPVRERGAVLKASMLCGLESNWGGVGARHVPM